MSTRTRARFAAFAFSVSCALSQTIAEPPPAASVFEQHAVAADHPLASQAGAEMLARGGNAVDAAVATSFALSVVRPFSCGIGGGGFMVVYLREHPRMRIEAGGLRAALNYRETAPAAVTPDYFEKLAGDARGRSASAIGAKAVGVPGTVAGLLEALHRWGTLDRATVMAPAIRLAREGFAVDDAYARAARAAIDGFNEHPDRKSRFTFTWRRFLGEGAVKPGDVIRLPEQADTLDAIARDGRDAFYAGAIARAIVAAIASDADGGGALTLADLAGYAPADAEPLTFTFRSRTFLGMPPPSSGGVCMAQTLGILERTALAPQIEHGLSPGYLHFLVESFKHAFADRARWLGDPAFVDVPLARMLDPQNLTALAGGITLGRVRGAYGTPDPEPRVPPDDDGGTSHLCVLDARGNAVACTETINLEFGSLLAAGGFCLNNEMDDFTTIRGEANAFGLRQSDANLPAPGKRPLSSMSPTIVLDAGDPPRVELVAGASGGPRIITATTQAILNAILFGKDAGAAVAFPRVHHQWMPNVLECDAEYSEMRWKGVRFVDWLRKQRHEIKRATRDAAVQLIHARGPGVIEAASDPRKGGAPAGR
ncbi:MAG: gamma-glutamyltransferase [Phycisphaerales bacterium]